LPDDRLLVRHSLCYSRKCLRLIDVGGVKFVVIGRIKYRKQLLIVKLVIFS